jgi:hypothetical protein
VSKAANLSAELVERGIRVNAVVTTPIGMKMDGPLEVLDAEGAATCPTRPRAERRPTCLAVGQVRAARGRPAPGASVPNRSTCRTGSGNAPPGGPPGPARDRLPLA